MPASLTSESVALTPEPTPLRRRRDARAAIQAERPTRPEDIHIVEETLDLSPVWADPAPALEAVVPDEMPVPAPSEDEAEQSIDSSPELAPATSESFAPLEAHHSTIAAAFIAPPTAAYRAPALSTVGDEPTPVRATDAGVPKSMKTQNRRRSLRSPAVVALAIPALLGTIALPAYAFSPGVGATAAVVDANAALSNEGPAAQSLTVSDSVALAQVERDGYSATSEAELEASYAAAGYIYDDAAALASYLAPSSSGWWRSLPGEITSKYGPRGLICNSVGCSSSFHEGMDFGGRDAAPRSRRRPQAPSASPATPVRLATASSSITATVLQTIYGHLLSGSYAVAVGDVIEGGTVIAEVGATGVVSGCHLDLKVTLDGQHTNPAPFLRERGVTV